MLRTSPCERLLQDLFIRLILVLRDFLENHIALQLEGVLRQGRIQHQVKQQLQCHRSLLRWNEHVEMNIVEARCGIAAAPEGFDGSVECTGLHPLTALEHHVLEEMGHALFTLVL